MATIVGQARVVIAAGIGLVEADITGHLAITIDSIEEVIIIVGDILQVHHMAATNAIAIELMVVRMDWVVRTNLVIVNQVVIIGNCPS